MRQHIAFTHGPLQPPGHVLHELIAVGMPIGLGERAHAIDMQAHHAQGPYPWEAGRVEALVQHPLEPGAVEQARQGVVLRGGVQGVLGLLERIDQRLLASLRTGIQFHAQMPHDQQHHHGPEQHHHQALAGQMLDTQAHGPGRHLHAPHHAHLTGVEQGADAQHQQATPPPGWLGHQAAPQNQRAEQAPRQGQQHGPCQTPEIPGNTGLEHDGRGMNEGQQAQAHGDQDATDEPQPQRKIRAGLHPDGGRADHDGRHPGGQHHRRHEADPDGQLQGHQIEQGLRPKARAHTQRATQPPAQAGIPVVATHAAHHRSLQEQGIHAERPGHEQGRQVKVGVHEGRRHARVPDKVPQSRQGVLPQSWALTPAAGTCEAPRACFR
mgnify:CR=1 FL=1